MDSRVDAVALVLVAAVAAVVALTVTPDGQPDRRVLEVTPNGRACPLTLTEEHKAGTAFEKVMPVLAHPRCFNCHGGVCTTSASGIVPIRLGADDNPCGLIRMEPDSNGAIIYSEGTGPWPDAYQPRYIYRYRQGQLLPGTPYAMHSW